MADWLAIERQLAVTRPQTWEIIQQRYDNVAPMVEKTIPLSQSDIDRYPRLNDNGEHLSQLLANLNYYVQLLGELHSVTEQLKIWTDKRYEAEKGIEKYRLIKEEKLAVGTADGAKYTNITQYLDIMVMCDGLDKRVQNARSSARDTTEAIRSRIGQLRGQLRSS